MKTKQEAKISYGQRRAVVQLSGALGVLLLLTGLKHGLINYVTDYQSFMIVMSLFIVCGITLVIGLRYGLKWLYTNAYQDGLRVDDFKWYKWENNGKEKEK